MDFETTDTLTKKQAEAFIEWFNENIGTYCEMNPSGSGEPDEYYIMFLDIESDAEWDMVAEKEVEYIALNNSRV